MTEEELKQESEVYFKSICGDYNEEYERTGKRHYWVGFDIKNAYLASAESREKRIAELEAQVEKMKCCSNCFYDCEDCNSKNKDCNKCPCGTCKKHNHWELRR